ncbi:Rha family transcriptional regulator [Cloacibacillus porcorum]|uniref:Rha family transcriptional regulator n=1 Tax=Cloacibacillus porcorum TaxID=1197717 RepID=UPI0012EE76F3
MSAGYLKKSSRLLRPGNECDATFCQSNFRLTNELGITIENNRPVVSSRKVAEVFEKEHKNVIRDIKALDCDAEFCVLNFEPTSRTVAMPRGGTREEPEYLMTRDVTASPIMR